MTDHLTLPFGESEPPEEWRPIAGYEGFYDVSSLGRVRSHHRHGPGKRGGLLAARPIAQGHYLAVVLSKNGTRKDRTIHQLVAEAFIGPRPEGQEVHHGPGGEFDNRASNLSYGTSAENYADMYRDGTVIIGEQHHNARLTAGKVQVIRARKAAGERAVLLAAEYGVSRPTINAVVNRKTWKHVA